MQSMLVFSHTFDVDQAAQEEEAERALLDAEAAAEAEQRIAAAMANHSSRPGRMSGTERVQMALNAGRMTLHGRSSLRNEWKGTAAAIEEVSLDS